MVTNHVLVDFENVQPDLAGLAATPFKVKVFFGAKQQESRVPYKLLKAMLALGDNVEAVEVTRSGKNALDMHIAYYIGGLLAAEPDASIHIISGDTDFDPLLEFLSGKGFTCKRTKTIGDLLKLKTPPLHAPKAARAPRAAPEPKPASDTLAPIVKQLRSLSGKPATRKKLAQTLATWFKQHGSEPGAKAIEQTIDELIRRKLVTQNGAKVNYSLG